MDTKQKFIEYVKTIFAVIISRKFLLNLGLAFIVLIAIIMLSSVFLRVLTNHGEQIYTPSFIGFTIEKAEEIADDYDVKIEIIDSVFEAPGERGTIVDQTPPANFLIKTGRTIFLTKKSFNAKKVEMPQVVNGSLIQAKSELETYGLLVGKLIYKPSPYENLVLEQMYDGKPIAAKTLIDVGSTIDLVVGKSEDGNKAFAPDLSGMTKNEASFFAAENSLNLGVLIYDNTVKTTQDSLNAKIWKQNPAKDKELELGSDIDVWLTTNPDLIKK